MPTSLKSPGLNVIKYNAVHDYFTLFEDRVSCIFVVDWFPIYTIQTQK